VGGGEQLAILVAIPQPLAVGIFAKRYLGNLDRFRLSKFVYSIVLLNLNELLVPIANEPENDSNPQRPRFADIDPPPPRRIMLDYNNIECAILRVAWIIFFG